jgi:hypothetical protein
MSFSDYLDFSGAALRLRVPELNHYPSSSQDSDIRGFLVDDDDDDVQLEYHSVILAVVTRGRQLLLLVDVVVAD